MNETGKSDKISLQTKSISTDEKYLAFLCKAQTMKVWRERKRRNVLGENGIGR